jgi:signal transduction histidine kinase
LHEFLASNRAELLAMALDKIRARAPGRSDADLFRGVPQVFDEIVRFMRRGVGLPDSEPEPKRAGAAVGDSKERDGRLIAYAIGAISDSLGELGGRQNLRFSAREYQLFDQALDESLAGAIEEHDARERKHQQVDTSKRVGYLAHEIRNALASARMTYDTLRSGVVGVNSRIGDALGRSLFAIHHLVTQTLAAVQLDAAIPVNLQRVDVSTFMQEIQETAVPQRGISLHFEVEPGLVVQADERLLSAVVTNLLQNALKFTRAAGNVTLRARSRADRASIEVEDECGGLPPDAEKLLVTTFSQHGSDRRGLGLGLSIAREAAEAQGGRLSFVDRPGKGCVFTVELPRPPQA